MVIHDQLLLHGLQPSIVTFSAAMNALAMSRDRTPRGEVKKNMIARVEMEQREAKRLRLAKAAQDLCVCVSQPTLLLSQTNPQQ